MEDRFDTSLTFSDFFGSDPLRNLISTMWLSIVILLCFASKRAASLSLVCSPLHVVVKQIMRRKLSKL